MKVIAWGSVIGDDAVRYSSGHHKTELRIVEINPFSLLYSLEMLQEGIGDEVCIYGQNDYRQFVFEMDLHNTVFDMIKKTNYDYLLLNLDSCRMPLYEFVFENGNKYRIKYSKDYEKHLVSIKAYLEKISSFKVSSVNIINPLKWDEKTLKGEIACFYKELIKNVSVKRIILLHTHNVYQFIRKDGFIMPVTRLINIVNMQNEFYDTCVRLFMNEYKGIYIPVPSNLIGNEPGFGLDMFHFSMRFYTYINQCLDAIDDGSYMDNKMKKLINAYDKMQMVEIKEHIYRTLVDLAYHKSYGRKIVAVGNDTVFSYALLKKYGMEIDVSISISMNKEEVISQLKTIKNKSDEYFCVIPNAYSDFSVFELLWDYGYGYGEGYRYVTHPTIALRNFSGCYKDYYGNSVLSKGIINCDIIAGFNSVRFYSSIKNSNTIALLHYNSLYVDSDVCVEKKGFSVKLYDGARVKIGKRVRLGSNIHIRGSFFYLIEIEDGSLIENDCVLFAGDGHSIFDVKTGENMNYQLSNSNDFKRKIVISHNTVIGRNCFVLAGTRTGCETKVEANSLLNKQYEERSVLKGNPAKRIKGDKDV